MVAGAVVSARLLPEGTILQVTGTYRWIVYGAAAALAGGFHRSRVFVAALGLAALDLVAGGSTEMDVLAALGTVYVVVVGLLALSRDRGIASPTGLTQVAASAAGGFVPGILFYDPVNLEAFLDLQLLPGGLTAWTGFPQSVALLSGGALVASGWSVYRWQGAVERGLVWTQVCVLGAIHPASGPTLDAVLLGAGGLVLALSVLETTYAMAYRDDLTGLPARRALMRDLDELSGTYTIAMVDVDHFKKFNDRYGHDVGDQVLKLVARHLERAPGRCRAYRYGGEEFTLLYPGITHHEAQGFLEEVRRSVEQATFVLRSWNRPKDPPPGPAKPPARKKTLSVTVSIGMADSEDVPDGDPMTVLKRADEALYRAKKAGRNRVSA